MTIQIHVTSDDVRDGLPADVTYCPVARAVARVVGRPVVVDYDSPTRERAHVEVGKVRRPLPERVAIWIHNYDEANEACPEEQPFEPEPVSFDLDLDLADVLEAEPPLVIEELERV